MKKRVEIEADLEWLKEFLPLAVKIHPGIWNEVRQYSDGRAYCYGGSFKGELYAIIGGRRDVAGRRWLSLMLSLQKGKHQSVSPPWDMVRFATSALFGERDWIIPAVPQPNSIGVMPATILLWSCLDGSCLPSWPEDMKPAEQTALVEPNPITEAT